MTVAEALMQVDALADKLGEPVDIGIRVMVAALHMHGIATYASCEGHLDHGFPYPWVDIGTYIEHPTTEKSVVLANRKHCARLVRLLKDYYQAQPVYTYQLGMEASGTMGDARLRAMGVPDIEAASLAEKTVRLRTNQADMQDFADYLVRRAI
jgi:hypothetical protein